MRSFIHLLQYVCTVFSSLLAFAGLSGALLVPSAALGAEKNSQKTAAVVAAPAKSDKERYELIALFQKVLYFIEQNYVEEVKTKDLVYGGIKGMLETLDAHSSFLPPEVFKDMKVDTTGKFGGLGIEISLKESIPIVVTPIEDTPAYKAGIKSGDRIVKIDGENTKGMNLVEAIAKMRGKRGTEITLTIMRDGFDKPKDFKLMRAEIKLATVKSELLEPGYLYARLTNFNEHSTTDLKKAMKDVEIKGMVLDLRNNPGGLLDQAVDVTSLFIDDGVVVSTIGRDKEKKDIRYAKKDMARKNFSLAVLVNAGSASASEIVAGALQDHKRAVIMGQPTFGKGSVQTVVELQPEVGLKLTVARYYTPSGRSIQLKGIQPDIVLDELDQKIVDSATKKHDFLREKDLKRHMGREGEAESNKDETPDENKKVLAKDDYQVREALNYIKSFQIFKATEK